MRNGRVPSNQVRGYRRVFSTTLSADNQQLTVDLPRGAAIENAVIVLDGTINTTVAGAAVRQLAPLQLLNRIDWILNGNITLHSASGIGSFLCDWLTARQPSALVPPAGAGVGAQTIRAEVRLNRALADMYRPKDSVLKTDENVTTNQLRITTGTLASILTGTPTIAYTALTLSVYVQDYQEAPDQQGRTPVPLWYPKISEQVVAFAGTGDQQPIRINTGNRLRALILRQEVSGEGTDSQLSNVRVIRSGDTRVDMPANALQFLRSKQLSGPAGFFGNPQATGVIPLDFANPGLYGARYSEFWPLPSNSDAQLLPAVAVAHSLRIVTLEGVDLQA